MTEQTEQLLTVNETAARLKMKRAAFYKHLPELRAKGLQTSMSGRKRVFTQSSLNRVIQKAIETETAIC